MYMIDVLQFRRILSDAIEGIYSDEDIAERIYSKICKSMEDDFYDEGCEVVRCKDCVYYEESLYDVVTNHDMVCVYASLHHFYREPNDYCSKGERKEQE